MDDYIRSILLKNSGAKKIYGEHLIQELWSGYGELKRIQFDSGSVILKLIKFPEQPNHPRGHNSIIGHERKKKSYNVEATWYQNFTTPSEKSLMAKHIASGKTSDYQYLILEDLLNQEFKPLFSLTQKQIEDCLTWLAHFHRKFLSTPPSGLWSVGTYWHLETRPNELALMTDKSLKEAAPLIDKRLNQAKYQTIVHGDAKLSNFLFNSHKAAAVDFQYVGGGIGIKDIAYFFSSIFDETELEANEDAYLKFYFRQLDLPEVEKEWRELYPFAWCDFYRFLQGWSPGHWKINTYTKKMKEKVLNSLS